MLQISIVLPVSIGLAVGAKDVNVFARINTVSYGYKYGIFEHKYFVHRKQSLLKHYSSNVSFRDIISREMYLTVLSREKI